MQPAREVDLRLHLELAVPVTRVGFGAFSVDPFAVLAGRPLAECWRPSAPGR